jgi:hypothetical protein
MLTKAGRAGPGWEGKAVERGEYGVGGAVEVVSGVRRLLWVIGVGLVCQQVQEPCLELAHQLFEPAHHRALSWFIVSKVGINRHSTQRIRAIGNNV